MKLSPIEQAFFDLYSGRISECDDHILLMFIESERGDKGQDDFYEMYGSYYSHLKDTYIAFDAGIEFGKSLSHTGETT